MNTHSYKTRSKKLRKRAKQNRERVIRKRGNNCYYCDKKMEDDQITMDHVLPIDRGGTSRVKNLVPCCQKCNGRKGNTPIHEYDFEHSRKIRRFVRKILNEGKRVPCTSVLKKELDVSGINNGTGKLAVHHIRCKEIFKYKNKFFIDNL